MCEVELRSVNHRHLKISPRVPEAVASLVPRLEERVRGVVARGSLYLTLRLEDQGAQQGARLDLGLLRQLHEQVAQAAREAGAPAPRLDVLCLAPGVVAPEERAVDADLAWPAAQAALDAALAELVEMRRVEGEALARDLLSITAEMRALSDALAADAPQAVAAEGERLRRRVGELLGEALQPGDLVREVALLADRADVSEELARLRSHLEQVEATIGDPQGPVGRKLEFLAQELQREANTMGSKCRDGALVQRALELKLCVERLKEQLANVE